MLLIHTVIISLETFENFYRTAWYISLKSLFVCATRKQILIFSFYYYNVIFIIWMKIKMTEHTMLTVSPPTTNIYLLPINGSFWTRINASRFHLTEEFVTIKFSI